MSRSAWLVLAYVAASISASLAMLLGMEIQSLRISGSLNGMPDIANSLFVYLILGPVYTLPCGLTGLILLRLTRRTSFLAYAVTGSGLGLLALAIAGPFGFDRTNIFLPGYAFAGAAAAITFRWIVPPSPNGWPAPIGRAPRYRWQQQLVAFLLAALAATCWLALTNAALSFGLSEEQRAPIQPGNYALVLLFLFAGIVLPFTLVCGLVGLGLLRLLRRESYLACGAVGFVLAFAVLAAKAVIDYGGIWPLSHILLQSLAGSAAAVVYNRLAPLTPPTGSGRGAHAAVNPSATG